MSPQDPSLGPTHPGPAADLHFISLPCAHFHSQDHTPTPLGGQCPPAHPNLLTHRLLKWIEEGIPKDPFLSPDLMKNNPWVEKGKCSIL